MSWIKTFYLNFSLGHKGGNNKGSRFNTIANHSIRSGERLEFSYSFNRNSRSSVSRNLCSLSNEKMCKVINLRLSCGIFNDGGSLCKNCGHHNIFSGPNTWERKYNVCTLKAFSGSFDVTIFNFNFCSQLFHSQKVNIYWTSTNRTSARKRNGSLFKTSKKWP